MAIFETYLILRVNDSQNSVELEFDYHFTENVFLPFSFTRPSSEMLDTFLKRLRLKLTKLKYMKSSKKMMKKSQSTIERCDIKIVTKDNVVVETERLRLIDLLNENLSLQINEYIYRNVKNPPWIASCELPKLFLVDCPVFPIVKMIDGSFTDVIIQWFVSEKVDNEEGWTLMTNDFIFTPREEHVGCFIRIDIHTTLNLKRQTFSLRSKEKVKPIPETEYQVALSLDKIKIQRGNGLRVCTYNILSENYADRKQSHEVLYRHCDPKFLAQKYRQCLLFRELRSIESDLVLLQEVGASFYQDMLLSFMETLGYDGIYQSKTGGRVSEGGAVFWRRASMSLVKDISVENLSVELANDSSELCVRMTTILKSDAQIWRRWQALSHCMTGCVLSFRDSLLIIANNHLFYHPRYELLRICQASLVLLRVQRTRLEYPSAAFLVAGDFNASPEDDTIRFIMDGSISYHNEEVGQTVTLDHDLGPLDSAFKDRVSFTNFTPDYIGVLDHIFFDRSHLQLLRTYPLPTKTDIETNVALPNKYHPSDHLPLVADFSFI